MPSGAGRSVGVVAVPSHLAVALELVVSRENNFFPGLQPDRLRVLQEPSTDLGSLGVQHDGTQTLRVQHGDSQVIQGLLVVLVRTVREVEARDAHSRSQELLQHLDRPRLWSESAYDLAGQGRRLCLLCIVVLLLVRFPSWLAEGRRRSGRHRWFQNGWFQLTLVLKCFLGTPSNIF